MFLTLFISFILFVLTIAVVFISLIIIMASPPALPHREEARRL
jgi:hypothetical protein